MESSSPPAARATRLLGAIRQRLGGQTARQLGRVLGLYGGVGVLVGLVAAAFVPAVELGLDWLLARDNVAAARGVGLVGLPELSDLWLLIVPAIGGLLSGLLCARWAPEAMGSGTAAVIDAYHLHGGVVRDRAPAAKFLASVLTIGSGGSAGVEGPVGFIAGGIGSVISRLLHLSVEERRILLMAGFAAGIGAVFHAPLAASLFAAEVLYRDLDMEHEVLLPSIVSSTMAYAVFGVIHGWNPIWTVPPGTGMHSVLELLPYLVLSGAVALAGALFISIQQTVQTRLGGSSRIKLWLRPAFGGLGVGFVALFVPGALGPGYAMAQLAIDGQAAAWVLVVLVLAKMLTSALTAGSGGSGGLFAPSLVLGALVGALVVRVSEWVAPGLELDPAAFAIVGMAGFFAAVVNAPVSTVIMVSELAGSYQLLVPTLWVCVLAWLMLRGVSLYSEQVPTRIEAPSHMMDMMDSVLRRIRVTDVMREESQSPQTVRPQMHIEELVGVFSGSLQGVFPIVDKTGHVLGVVDRRAMTRAIGQEGLDAMLIAVDFLAPAITARPDEGLDTVIARMASSGFDVLLVTEPGAGSELRGLISRREIVAAYHQRILERATRAEAHSNGPTSAPAVAAGRAPELELAEALRHGDLRYDIEGEGPLEVLSRIVEAAPLPEGFDRERLLSQLIERERLGSTNMGDGLAIPHPQTEGFEDFGRARLLVATLSRPTRWELDGGERGVSDAPVQTVLALLTPSGDVHLTLLSALARCLSDPGVRRLIKQRVSRERLAAHLESLAS